jgi:hypothetical protein
LRDRGARPRAACFSFCKKTGKYREDYSHAVPERARATLACEMQMRAALPRRASQRWWL